MALNKSRLRAQIVFLEVLETRRAEMHAGGYLAAARALRHTIERELCNVPMQAFMSPDLPTLEATAQNVFFDSRRRFADMDGNGHAARAQCEADRLLARLRKPVGQSVRQPLRPALRKPSSKPSSKP